MRWWMIPIGALVACNGAARHATPAYQGCTLDDPEELCEEGTECDESAIVASGNGFCTVGCVLGTDDCPGQEDGLETGCHQPDGADRAQCYASCPDGTCPLSTACVEVTEGGGPIALCLPR